MESGLIELGEVIVKYVVGPIGTIGAAYVFIVKMIKPALKYNREKFSKLKDIITEDDFQILTDSAHIRRQIDPWAEEKLLKLISMVDTNHETLDFKESFLLSSSYQFHINQIRILYNEWKEFVCVPYWEPIGSSDGVIWAISKKYFYDQCESTQDYSEADIRFSNNLMQSGDIPQKMRDHYRTIRKFSEMTEFELLLLFGKQALSSKRFWSCIVAAAILGCFFFILALKFVVDPKEKVEAVNSSQSEAIELESPKVPTKLSLPELKESK
jgi:hypothetical protein